MDNRKEGISDLHNDLTYTIGLNRYPISDDNWVPGTGHVPPSMRFEQLVDEQCLSDLRDQGIDYKALSEEDRADLVRRTMEKYHETVVGSIFDDYTVPGLIKGGTLTIEERTKRTIEHLDRYERWGFKAVFDGKDIQPGKFNFLASIEGMDFVQEVEQVKTLLNRGVRIFGPQYGKDNTLSNVENGLTKFGREVVSLIFDAGSAIDLAHSSPKTRAGIIDIAEEKGCGNLLSYTHGAQEGDLETGWEEKMAYRVITAKEIKKIAELGGIIGMGVTRPFFGSIEGIARRINDVCQLENGPQSIAIGTDFGGVPNALVFPEIHNHRQAGIVIGNLLSDMFNLDDDVISGILRSNVTNWTSKLRTSLHNIDTN